MEMLFNSQNLLSKLKIARINSYNQEIRNFILDVVVMLY